MAMELRLVMLCALALVNGAISAVTFEHGVTGLVVRTMSAEPVVEQHLVKFDTWFPGGSFMNYKNESSAEKGEASKCAMWCETTGCDMYQLDAHQQVRDCGVLGSAAVLRKGTSLALDMSVKALEFEPNGVLESARMAQQNMFAMAMDQVDQTNPRWTCHNSLYFDDILDISIDHYDMTYFLDIDFIETYDQNFDYVVNYNQDFVDILERIAEEKYGFFVNVFGYDLEPIEQCLEKYATNILLWLVAFILDVLDYVVKVFLGLLRGQSGTLLAVLAMVVSGFGIPMTIALLRWCVSPTRTYVCSGLRMVFWMAAVLWRVTERRVVECSLMLVMSVCIIWILAISNKNICSAFRTTRSNRCDKRKERKIRVGNKRKLVALIFMCSVFHSSAMEQQQAMLERVAALAEAATRAAIAAERVAGQTTASSSTSGDGLSHASKLLKSPESFSGEDALNFPSWRFQFTSCLTYGESKYVAMLKKIEALTTSPDIATYSPEERVLAL